MEIGTVLGRYAGEPTNMVDTTVEHARTAYQLGIRSGWLGQRFDYDAIALAALVGREVPGLAVGTSAVPVIGRHPLLVGALAQTAQAATGGRFQLGIGLGATELLRGVFGDVPGTGPDSGPNTGARPIARLREFLVALRALLDTGEVDFAGELVTARTPFPSALPGARPTPPVLVAAMGPRALRVTGQLADGTLPFLAGPKTLAELVVPTINEAAASAGRPRPRVVAMVPGVVTDAVADTTERAYQAMGFYETIPSYRAVLAREGVERAGDLAVIGSADHLAEELHRYLAAGATEVVLTQTDLAGPDDQLRTWELLGQLSVRTVLPRERHSHANY
jgi:F420-dependent oxidoreductase-like protein